MIILLLSPIWEPAESALRKNHEVYSFSKLGSIPDNLLLSTEVIITRSGNNLLKNELSRFPLLKLLIRAGSGTDNIDLDYLQNNNIHFFNIKSFHKNAVAELAFGLMLDLSRNITFYHNSMSEGKWEKGIKQGVELSGKTLGIIGFGQIGLRIAELGRSWDMNIFGLVKNFSQDRAENLKAAGITLVQSPNDIAKLADLIIVALPLDENTKNFIDAAFISKMKKHAIIVNVGRGGTIDNEALYDALTQQFIGGAAMDVHLNEGDISKFSSLSNVILTPHIGSSTQETQANIGNELFNLIQNFKK